MDGEPVKIIFLDVDGVLNSVAFWTSPRYIRGRHAIDAEAVVLLNRLTDRTGARLVVSSTWRKRGARAMRQTLRDVGITAPMLGITPDLSHRERGPLWVATERGTEIQAWLDTTRRQVNRFVILDDDNDMAHLADRLVRTDYHVGLTAADIERAEALLADA